MPDFNKVVARHHAAWLLLGNAVGLTLARDIRAASPGTLILLRAQADNWEIDLDWTRGFAERSMAVAAPFQAAGVIDLLLPPNEPIAQNGETARRLNDCQVLIAGLYKANGYQTGAYNFSVGNPEYGLWLYLLDGIRACDGWLLLHEYGAPAMQSNATDLALRHRRVYDLVPSDVRAMLKVGITETGIDLGIGRPPDGAPTEGGYRNLPQQGDSENYWIDNYLSQLAWYDGELAKDTYVKFATVFGYGMGEPWNRLGFDVAKVDTDREKFIGWLQPGGVSVPPIVPPPEPAFRFARFPLVGNYPVTQAFGENPAMYAPFGLPGHDGEDEGCRAWTPVYAVADGTVARSTIGNYGNHITITHIADWQTLYAHLSVFSVSAGQAVQAGDLLGYSGATGNVTGPHLHFGLFRKNHFYTDANGVLWPFNIFDCTPYLDAVRPGAQPPIGDGMSTPQERIAHVWGSVGIDFNPGAAFFTFARAKQLGYPVGNEYSYTDAAGAEQAGQGFSVAFVETRKGEFNQDQIKAYNWLTGEVYAAPQPPVVNPPPGGPLPYSFPQALTDIGAVGHEGSPIAGKPFYRLNGASTRTGISAFMVMTVIGAGGIPVVGAQVVNQFPDGHGEVVLTDGSGAARFQFGASSAFSNPGGGPFTVFVAEGAVKDDGTKVVTWKLKLSDTIASLGDFGGQHQEIYVQFVKQ